MNHLIAVSVLMAVYDPDPVYLRDAIRGVLDQTLADFELLIIEDPGPRSAESVTRDFSDDRIRYIRSDFRRGLGASLNSGLRLAQSDLVARIDADDLCRPDRLELQVAFLRNHPEISVYGSRIRVVDDRGQPVGHRLLPLRHDEIASAFQRYNCISHPAVMFRRADAMAVGGYSETGRAEDYDLWCRMLGAGFRFENASEALISYRFHPRALKRSDVHEEIRATIEIKRRYFGSTMDMHARLRMLGEHVLLHLPSSLVISLFRRLEYRS
jgi:glycosyltransferase involved in cell wall biosynthesis